MEDRPATEDETSPPQKEASELDVVVEPFTPPTTRPGTGMNPRATPWTPSTYLTPSPHTHGTFGTPYLPYFPATAPPPPFPSRASYERRREVGFGAPRGRQHAPPSLPNDMHNNGGVQRPRNDLSLNFVHTGERPQNFIADGRVDTQTRLARFPTRKELCLLKRDHTKAHAFPSMTLRCDVSDSSTLRPETVGNVKFDVIYVSPPWHEEGWSPSKVALLQISKIAEQNGSFCFLWCGDGNDELLECGRECLQKWGFRRVEEIVWLKTNHKHDGLGNTDEMDVEECKIDDQEQPDKKPNVCPVLLPTKEHCLVGICGNVRRDRDGHIMHANIDVDVIVAPEPMDKNDTSKPHEMYEVIENFCQGRRRVELFGSDQNLRPGWLTLGDDLSSSNFDADVFAGYFSGPQGHVLPRHPRIEALRPKTPPFARTGTLHP